MSRKEIGVALQLVSHSPDQTQFLGRLIGEHALAGDVFLLIGELGAGKTCLAQGIAWGLGVTDYTASPSFVIVREYKGRLPLYHMDFYRLTHLEEVAGLGLDEYLSGKGASVIEWPERGLPELPRESLSVRIEYLSSTDRALVLEPVGRRYVELNASVEIGLQGERGVRWNWL